LFALFSDLIASYTTAIAPAHRALGYLDEALDMRRRARINRTAWQPHLDNTRRFVLSAAEQCRDRGKAVILGSGLLLDVPLAELSALFKGVVLKDVVCFPEIRNRISRCRNARFVEHDITGLAERLYGLRQQVFRHLPEPRRARADEDHDAGLVVSLNILSQLWVVPRAFIGQSHRLFAAEEVDEWCGRIVAAHYDYLRSLSCDVCLVADHGSVKRDPAGHIISRTSSVYGLELPPPDSSWAWDIAPLGKGNPHTSKELIVGAWRFSRS